MTPALIVDLDAVESNIATMAEWTAREGLRLRPHAKSHKSPEVAKLQISAGAVGLCCASIREAEILAAAGIPGLLITTPIGPNKAGRLAALRAGGADVTAVADSVAVFEAYESAGIILIFTEENALSSDDLRHTAYNTYHAAFRYVHALSGQGLRPANRRAPSRSSHLLPTAWAECARQAGYVSVPKYGVRSQCSRWCWACLPSPSS